eukprot:1161265-Pelagomonas_calceolata.AAC.8
MLPSRPASWVPSNVRRSSNVRRGRQATCKGAAAEHQRTAAAKSSFRQQLDAMQSNELVSDEEGSSSSNSSSSGCSSVASLLSYDELEDQQRMFMHEMLESLQRRSKAPIPAPAPKSNSKSDSRDSNRNGCSSADEQESARKKQASESATVASRAAELGHAREQGGNLSIWRCMEVEDGFLPDGLVHMQSA